MHPSHISTVIHVLMGLTHNSLSKWHMSRIISDLSIIFVVTIVIRRVIMVMMVIHDYY